MVIRSTRMHSVDATCVDDIKLGGLPRSLALDTIVDTRVYPHAINFCRIKPCTMAGKCIMYVHVHGPSPTLRSGFALG